MDDRRDSKGCAAWLRRFPLVLGLLTLVACASLQTVDVDDAMRHPPAPGIDIGSLVEIRTLDDRKLRFRVTELADEGLGGKFGFVAYEDMASLKVERKGSGDGGAAGYVFGVLGILALIALIDSADTVRICSQPPC